MQRKLRVTRSGTSLCAQLRTINLYRAVRFVTKKQEIIKMWMDPELLKVSKHTQHLPLQNQEFVEVDVHVIRVTVTEKEEKGTVIKLLRFIFSFLFSNVILYDQYTSSTCTQL